MSTDTDAPAQPQTAAPPTASLRRRRPFGALLLLVVLMGLALLTWFAVDEAQTSRRQAGWLAALTPQLQFEVGAGASDAIRFPGDGPYDQRLGYHALPGFIEQLGAQHWRVESQARMSPKLVDLVDRGLYAPYDEKAQAGLQIDDCRGQALYASRHPQRAYARFEAVPPLVANTLLHIEDRDLLDAQRPMLNPAVDWARFGSALFDQVRSVFDPGHPTPGGSTLATQIEKYQHSPGGRTDSAHEKLVQMASASVRAYLGGEQNLPRRRQIVTHYLDTVPLAARAGIGEVHGLGDALWAWYGRDFAEVNRLLFAPPDDGRPNGAPPDAALLPRQALAYKQVLSLLIAQRRPSYYLGQPEAETGLRQLVDAHLRLLADAGVIPPALRDAALPMPLQLHATPPSLAGVAITEPYSERKAATALRGQLSGLLGIGSNYGLDRLDLRAGSSIDAPVQRAAAALLRSLGERDGARAAGLYGPYLLTEGDDPSRLVFSFTLFERGEHTNRLRVQTDNLDQPFDINAGARLDLGSTAKLRTLVSYLQLLAELHAKWTAIDPVMLAATQVEPRDALGRWARQHLLQAADRSLPAMLEAAMQRGYSASPAEAFFTGGGLHRFENFEAADNHRVLTLREATTRSVNLVYIRLMREIVYHLMYRDPSTAAVLDGDRDDPARQAMLARFADKEGREYLARFWREFRGLAADDIVAQLLQGRAVSVPRLAALWGELAPEGDAAALGNFLAQHLPGVPPDADELARLHARYAGGRMTLDDRAHVASAHPLALWLAGHLRRTPQASWSQTVEAGADARQQSYRWLFRTRHRSAQDTRIRSLLEIDVFAQIQKRWQRLGYPFEALTPSYASAIGASGDRPSALAELMGIITSGGLRQPVARLETLAFAAGTPFETRLAYKPPAPERVLDAAVAATARRALLNVVEEGTARRLKGVFVNDDGSAVEVGGKTGTGDHRYDTFGKGGRLISSRVVSRSATLMFLIGDRYYGTVMAFVNEPYAANYRFTSALPAQLLKALAPTLQPLLNASSCR